MESPQNKGGSVPSLHKIYYSADVVWSFRCHGKAQNHKVCPRNFQQLFLATSHQKLYDLLMTSSNFLKEKIVRTLGVMGRHKFLTIAGATLMAAIKNVYV